MSKVTLDDLRADFDRKRCAFINGTEWFQRALYDLKGKQLRWRWWIEDYDDLANGIFWAEYGEADVVRFAANILDVAEQHGLEAAMLYKLSDGAIDPRKGV